MSWTSPHTIREQVLEVELNGSESDGLLLQRSLPTLFTQGLLPAIERALDRCAPEQGFATIERVDIDVGSMASDRLEHDLPQAVMLALEKELIDQMVRHKGTGAVSPARHGYRRKTTQQMLDEALAYFLNTGSLPSSWYLPQDETFEKILLSAWREAEETGVSLSDAGSVLAGALDSEAGRERLTLQFSTEFLFALLARLSPKGAKTMEGILAAIRRTSLPASDVKAVERQLWKRLFTHVVTDGVIAPRVLVEETTHFLPADAAGRGRAILADLLERQWRDGGSIDFPLVKPIEPARPGKAEIESTVHPQAKEGIFINNAGLVLLHPFLGRFFEGLDVAAGPRLLQPVRALHLLHYLSSGLTPAVEYELALPKILCNWPLTKPVEAGLELRASEKDEAVALLEAVIAHWTALRNTSPDGLREAFLLRAGKLSLHDGDWLLQIESRTIDILFNQLPWGISMIKLPWMNKVLAVEWG